MGNTLAHADMTAEEQAFYSSEAVDRQYSKRSDRHAMAMSSITHSISDKFRSGESANDVIDRRSPQVSNFAEIHLQEIMIESAPRLLDQIIDKDSDPISEIDIKVIEQDGEARDEQESKYVSLCLMAMNLESMIDETEDIMPIEALELQMMDHEYCRVTREKPLSKYQMDIELIGNMTMDCSEERPKLILNDKEGNRCFQGYLKPSQAIVKQRNEISTLNNSMNNMVQMVQLLHNKIGVLEERVRYVENSYSLSQSLKE